MKTTLDPERRVVVTGMGLVSALGLTLGDVAESLREGRSGVQAVEQRRELGFRCTLSGVIENFDAAEHLKKKERKNMGEHTQFLAVAAASAFAQPSAEASLFASERAGVIIGNDSSAGAATDVLDGTRDEGSTLSLGSGAVVRCMNSSPSINLGVKYKVKGMSMTVSAADAGGAHAIGLGWLAIKTGQLDRAIVGGCQELCWESMAAFDAREAFTVYDGDPAAASRPFDCDREGLVPGGGAGVLLLEDLASARERGATIWGEIASYAMTSDGKPREGASAGGHRRCMRDALDRAEMNENEIDMVAADGSGSVAFDLAEARAIEEIFGSDGPPVAATKSMTGHEGWASGPMRTAYALLMMRGGFIAPNINFSAFAEGEPHINTSSQVRDAELKSVLVDTFGYGGTNACLLLLACE